MAAERIIGVDFGTSTSVIRVKRYQDGEPIGDRLGTDKVTFNMGSTMVPTLIQKLPTGDAYFGYDAEIPRRKTNTFQNFKVDIENPDEDVRRQARELTAEYFTYLAKSYRAQSEGGHLGESDDKERTIISYPVKWSDEAKAFMVRTAKDAGFPNVEGVDEAQAAIQAVTIQNADLLTRKGYFRDGVPVNILLIDMGAGTTDLVLCRHTPGEQPQTDILSTWPQGGNALFGGREVDELLKSYICRTIPEDDAEMVLRKIGLEKYKSWKEGIVSPALEKGETVDSFAALDDLLDVLESEAEYSIDRDSFETYAAGYLRQLPELVYGCASAAGLSGDDIDLVILTGGHSQWYFVREMLSGKLERFGKVSLEKVQADPERIIPISLPQETVALGLVYSSMKQTPKRKDTQAVSGTADTKSSPVQNDNRQDKDAEHVEIRETSGMVSSGRTDNTPFEILQDNFISAKGRFTSCGSVAFVKADGSVVSENTQLCALTNVRDFCGTFESSVADSTFLFYLIRNRYDEFVLVPGFQPTKLQQKNLNKWLNTLITPNTKRIWTSCISFETISQQKWLLAGITPDGRVITNDKRNGISAVDSWRNIAKAKSGELFFYGITNQGSVRIASYQLNTSAIASDLEKEINSYLSSNQLQAVDICPCEETGVGGRAKVAVLLNNHCIRCFGEWGKKLQHKNTLERMSGVAQLLRDYTAYMGNFLAEERFDGVYKNGKIFEINKNGILSDKTLLDGKRCVGILPMFGINVRQYMTEDFRITSNRSSNHRILVKSGQDRMENQAAFEKNTVFNFLV